VKRVEIKDYAKSLTGLTSLEPTGCLKKREINFSELMSFNLRTAQSERQLDCTLSQARVITEGAGDSGRNFVLAMTKLWMKLCILKKDKFTAKEACFIS